MQTERGMQLRAKVNQTVEAVAVMYYISLPGAFMFWFLYRLNKHNVSWYVFGMKLIITIFSLWPYITKY